MNLTVYQYLLKLESEFHLIPVQRQKNLNNIGIYIGNKIKQENEFKGVIICTHNSRRSHFGQVWLAAAAAFYNLDDSVNTFSGGTEATAVYPSVIQSLKKVGLDIVFEEINTENPTYEVSWNEGIKPSVLFSKKYTAQPNPSSNFTAIMVCNDADEACPIVTGADMRFSLAFQDPKIFDGSLEELDQYDHTCKNIAREMVYIMSQAAGLRAE